MGSFMEDKWFQYKDYLNRLRLFRLGKKERKRERTGKMLRILTKRKKDKLIEEKSTEKKHYKQLFNRGTKPDI